MRRRSFTERIEVGLEVSERTVGVDQLVDARLLEAVDDRSRGVGLGRVARSLREGRDWGIAVGAQRKPLKKRAPSGVDRVGVAEPGLIRCLKDVGVSEGGKVGTEHGWKGSR